jgi:aminoglycoside phosphotransferase
MTRRFKKHEERVGIPTLPTDIASLLHDCTFFKLVRNYPSPTNVYRVTTPGNPTLFLKAGRDLGPERERLLWLEGKLPVPGVAAYSTLENQEYLLLKEVPGLPADDEKWDADIAGLVQILAKEVHTIHSVPKTGCPFDASLETMMSKAEKVVRERLIHSCDLSEAYRHRSIDDLFDNLLHLYPENEHIVFTHGDLCLPNILIQGGVSVGFVDLGAAGLSDPHRDLALIARSIRSNLGEKWRRFFFDAYGHYGHEVDERKIEFYSLLDQFTMMRQDSNAQIIPYKE